MLQRMTMNIVLAISATLVAVADFANHAWAQDAPITVEAKAVTVDAVPSAVTVYPGRAAVTRSARLSLDVGAYDVTFANLPPQIDSASLQVRARGPIRVLGVKYEEREVLEPVDDRLRELARRIDDLKLQLDYIEQDRGELEQQRKTLRSIADRIATATAGDAGTDQLDAGALGTLVDFLADRRRTLLETERSLNKGEQSLRAELRVVESERRKIQIGSEHTTRSAIVQCVVTGSNVPVELDLLYQVHNAMWAPRYNVRADIDGSTAQIEYDALIGQQTGEDWKDVELTLSTARPDISVTPPTLEPWYVSVVEPVTADAQRPASRLSAREKRKAPARSPGWTKGQIFSESDAPDRPGDEVAEELLYMARQAYVQSGGVAVTYTLPRKVTVLTNAESEQSTRIASIEVIPEFAHLAGPIASPHVYLRGTLDNTSDFHLLPGPAAIFYGSDYVGTADMPSVAPGAEFKVYFGIEQRITVSRQLVTKKKSRSGFGNSQSRTDYDYRLTIANNTGRSVKLELWDRMPVSRDEKIKVELKNPTHKLSLDAQYLQEDRPRGLLRWDLEVPASARTGREMKIDFHITVSHKKTVQTTALPD